MNSAGSSQEGNATGPRTAGLTTPISAKNSDNLAAFLQTQKAVMENVMLSTPMLVGTLYETSPVPSVNVASTTSRGLR